MKSLRALTLSTFIGLTVLAPQAMAQITPSRQIKPPELTKVPAIKNEALPTVTSPLFTAVPLEFQNMEIVQIAPPPGVAWTWCEATEARITRKAYQFVCKMTYPDGHSKRSLWVIRRDGSAPSWAMAPEDFEDVMQIISEKRYGFEFAATQPRGSKIYFRSFYTKQGAKAPNQYCSANILDYRTAEEGADRGILGSLGSPDGHNNMDCYDLMTISFKPQKEN